MGISLSQLATFGIGHEASGAAKNTWCYKVQFLKDKAVYIGKPITWEDWKKKLIYVLDKRYDNNTIVDEFKEPIILNSEDYILEDIRPYISDEGIKTFAVNLKSMYDGHITQPFLIVDTKDASFLKYKEILTHLYNLSLIHISEPTRH